MIEDGEEDHKLLGVIPGEAIIVDDRVRNTLKDFILGVSSAYPDSSVTVGPIRAIPESIAETFGR